MGKDNEKEHKTLLRIKEKILLATNSVIVDSPSRSPLSLLSMQFKLESRTHIAKGGIN